MNPSDIKQAFQPTREGLDLGTRLLLTPPPSGKLPDLLGPPVGPHRALQDLAGAVLSGATHLDDPGFFAHMDPATPWVTWVAAQWAARLNQNLLHTDTGAVAREVECTVVELLAPYWGMNGGHLVPGSTVANLTALWAARDLRNITTVVASADAHVSVTKSAHLLGLDYRQVPTDSTGRVDFRQWGNLHNCAVVLTAGTTVLGSIDPLERPAAAWVHVDAAWAGPLRLSTRWGHLLAGVEDADSVAVSAHKWLHQPKESALVMFRDTATAHDALSSGAEYLANPNVGLLGSHGYAALPLAATIRAYGISGLGDWVDHEMALTAQLAERISAEPALDLWGSGPRAGIVVWRHRSADTKELHHHLQNSFVSLASVGEEWWLRSVAANPFADPDRVVDSVLAAAAALSRDSR